MLALLQAEARLVDFLMEDISGANDEQIGQAVREIHKKAQAALKQHAEIEPVLAGNEGDNTTVTKGFDPSAIRVVGNVTGEPPFTGQINHPGWRVKELEARRAARRGRRVRAATSGSADRVTSRWDRGRLGRACRRTTMPF